MSCDYTYVLYSLAYEVISFFAPSQAQPISGVKTDLQNKMNIL